MENSEKALLTIPQAADRLSVTVSCVRRWVMERRLASVKLGRLRRIPASEISRLVNANFQPARREK
jgi:excisionase family DNA binding protein